LNGPWIEFVFGYHLGIFEDFKAKHGLYVKLLKNKIKIGKFGLCSSIEV
jgi:hypothetical protein